MRRSSAEAFIGRRAKLRDYGNHIHCSWHIKLGVLGGGRAVMVRQGPKSRSVRVK